MSNNNWANKWATVRCERCGRRTTQMIMNLMNMLWECDVCVSSAKVKKKTSSNLTLPSTSRQIPTAVQNLPSSSNRKRVWNENRMVVALCETCKKEITRTIKHFKWSVCWECDACALIPTEEFIQESCPATITSQSTSHQSSTSHRALQSSSADENISNYPRISYTPPSDSDNNPDANATMNNLIPSSSTLNSEIDSNSQAMPTSHQSTPSHRALPSSSTAKLYTDPVTGVYTYTPVSYTSVSDRSNIRQSNVAMVKPMPSSSTLNIDSNSEAMSTYHQSSPSHRALPSSSTATATTFTEADTDECLRNYTPVSYTTASDSSNVPQSNVATINPMPSSSTVNSDIDSNSEARVLDNVEEIYSSAIDEPATAPTEEDELNSPESSVYDAPNLEEIDIHEAVTPPLADFIGLGNAYNMPTVFNGAYSRLNQVHTADVMGLGNGQNMPEPATPPIGDNMDLGNGHNMPENSESDASNEAWNVSSNHD